MEPPPDHSGLSLDQEAALLAACEDVALGNENHLSQHLDRRVPEVDEAAIQTIKFMQMLITGPGVSRSQAENMLAHCKEPGGQNHLLPDTHEACLGTTTDLIDALQGGRKTYTLDIPIPQDVRALAPVLSFLAPRNLSLSLRRTFFFSCAVLYSFLAPCLSLSLRRTFFFPCAAPYSFLWPCLIFFSFAPHLFLSLIYSWWILAKQQFISHLKTPSSR